MSPTKSLAILTTLLLGTALAPIVYAAPPDTDGTPQEARPQDTDQPAEGPIDPGETGGADHHGGFHAGGHDHAHHGDGHVDYETNDAPDETPGDDDGPIDPKTQGGAHDAPEGHGGN